MSLDKIPGQTASVLHVWESLRIGQAAPPQEAGMVTLLLLLLVPEQVLEQVPHEDQEDTEQLTVEKKR